MQKKKKISILIVDDHPMMQTGIRTVLEANPHFEISGTATDAEEALEKVAGLSPDIVLMDITLKGMGGIEASSLISAQHPESRVIILTMHDQSEYVSQFERSGAHGYILKSAPPSELIAAIESVHNGGTFLSPSITRLVIGGTAAGSNPPSLLTAKELQVVRLLARGFLSKEIAYEMKIGLRTVAKYREVIRRKLGLKSVAEITRYAITHKLIELDPR